MGQLSNGASVALAAGEVDLLLVDTYKVLDHHIVNASQVLELVALLQVH